MLFDPFLFNLGMHIKLEHRKNAPVAGKTYQQASNTISL